MKNILITVGVIIIVVVVGLVVFRSTENGVQTTDQKQQDQTGSEDIAPGQFVQLQPTDIPTEAVPAGESPVVNFSQEVSGGTDAPTGESSTQQEVTVSVTDAGFVPASVTVKAGTTVVFVNNGQGLHWPASDIHPTHELLKGFDALHGLVTGETYSFTFQQKGSWGYHDHPNPSVKGTVVVE